MEGGRCNVLRRFSRCAARVSVSERCSGESLGILVSKQCHETRLPPPSNAVGPHGGRYHMRGADARNCGALAGASTTVPSDDLGVLSGGRGECIDAWCRSIDATVCAVGVARYIRTGHTGSIFSYLQEPGIRNMVRVEWEKYERLPRLRLPRSPRVSTSVAAGPCSGLGRDPGLGPRRRPALRWLEPGGLQQPCAGGRAHASLRSPREGSFAPRSVLYSYSEDPDPEGSRQILISLSIRF